jgi:hypothetical protein
VGIGISVGSHATLQATREIERADVVLTLVPDQVTEYWIRSLNRRAEPLGGSYLPGRNRVELYEQMAEVMLAHVRGGARVCGVAFGHPGIVATPFHRAIERARDEGFEATMLPAVSSLDCLFADLGVDPARDGCCVYDATEFLARPRTVDASTSLVLFQLGVIGDPTVPAAEHAPSSGLRTLSAALARAYGPSHRVAAYVAAQHVIARPRIDWIELERLASMTIDRSATLYVPPLEIERM